MRFVTFEDAEDAALVKVRADAVLAVAGRLSGNRRSADRCHLLLSGESGMLVRGSVDEVTAALEASTVSDAARHAADVCDALARVAAKEHRVPDWYDIDIAIGVDPDASDWSDTAAALTALAQRLRGAP